MRDYVHYCSEEQKEKIRQLGGPVLDIEEDSKVCKLYRSAIYATIPKKEAEKVYKKVIYTTSMPTTQMAINWLMEKFGITSFEIHCYELSKTKHFYGYFISGGGISVIENGGTSNWTYKEAELKAIDYALDFFLKKQTEETKE